jgi:hypothetical protein
MREPTRDGLRNGSRVQRSKVWKMRHPPADRIGSSACLVKGATDEGLSDEVIFQRLLVGLKRDVGLRVLTVLNLDPGTLRSVRLYSSEASYPIGGIKQHVRSAWSDAVIDRHAVFLARNIRELRASFPDSAAIEATGCGSIIAVPVLSAGTLIATMNLWHREGFYDADKGERAIPFADALAPLCLRNK